MGHDPAASVREPATPDPSRDRRHSVHQHRPGLRPLRSQRLYRPPAHQSRNTGRYCGADQRSARRSAGKGVLPAQGSARYCVTRTNKNAGPRAGVREGMQQLLLSDRHNSSPELKSQTRTRYQTTDIDHTPKSPQTDLCYLTRSWLLRSAAAWPLHSQGSSGQQNRTQDMG